MLEDCLKSSGECGATYEIRGRGSVAAGTRRQVDSAFISYRQIDCDTTRLGDTAPCVTDIGFITRDDAGDRIGNHRESFNVLDKITQSPRTVPRPRVPLLPGNPAPPLIVHSLSECSLSGNALRGCNIIITLLVYKSVSKTNAKENFLIKTTFI